MFSSATSEVVGPLSTTNATSDPPILHFPEASSSHLFPHELPPFIHHESDAYSPPTPSVRLIFSVLPRRDLYLVVLPAFVLSLVAGIVAPFMTLILSNVFNIFTDFSRIPSPSSSDRANFKHDIAISVLELLFLAAGSLALGSLTTFLWIFTGERISFIIQREVYASVSRREMAWFDTKMTADRASTNDDGSTGAGGLMARFANDCDSVRMASSLASGLLVQHITTCVTCFVLAFFRSWALTLVILSVVPVIVVLHLILQRIAGPLLSAKAAQSRLATALVDRAVSAIATVKAFNAISHEQFAFHSAIQKLKSSAWRVNRIWAVTSGLSQLISLGLFVPGFWFGAKLVRDGSIEAGQVIGVFWACRIATASFQTCIPQLITLTKGKFDIGGLIELIEAPDPGPSNVSITRRPHVSRSLLKRKPGSIRGIIPRSFAGEINLHQVTFAYPSRPSIPVLINVTIYIPAFETTYIVGGSGSGKSTIAQLMLHMYNVQGGTISLDDQDIQYLDTNWTRQQIGVVSQVVILFDMTIHDNVAMGLAGSGSKRRPHDATREEVIEACRAALLHRFIEDLPNGYDTRLGNDGANLSGGQRQRLAIARAILRDPTVLILDEATSALDATSRILVFEAIKHRRRNKTTIVITHDLSQISPTDFAYVLREGAVVEWGFRGDLEVAGGEFQQMAMTQAEAGGFSVKEKHEYSAELVLQRDQDGEKIIRSRSVQSPSVRAVKRKTMAAQLITVGNWMSEVVSDLTRSGHRAATQPTDMVAKRNTTHLSRFVPVKAFGDCPPAPPKRRPSTLAIDIPPPSAAHTTVPRHLSLQVSSISSAYSLGSSNSSIGVGGSDSEDEKKALIHAVLSRRRFYDGALYKRERKCWNTFKLEGRAVEAVTVEQPPQVDTSQEPLFSVLGAVYRTMPCKPLISLGIVLAIISGAMTPIFSFMLSQLLVEVSKGAQDVSTINAFGGIILAVAIADGLFVGLKVIVLETAGQHWMSRLRTTCYPLVLAQDKRWFDRSENAASEVCHIFIHDGNDASSLISAAIPQAVVVVSILTVGLTCAFARGWQLTLVGFGIGLVFSLTTAVQSRLVAKCEVRNKRARDEVARGYYHMLINIRGIRAMGFENVFQERFNESTEKAFRMGVRGGFVEGCTYGLASSLIYLSEAVLFYTAAILVSNGTYSHLQMVQVFSLVAFTVTISSQLMASTQGIAKSLQATRDFNRLLKLTTDTDESHGYACPPITGAISFNNVSFFYPERPEIPVLKNLSVDIKQGESVAIVGSSGSGKSTMAHLLQRLYEPTSGSITVGPWSLKYMDVKHLRSHISIVSQYPHLFHATVSENIAYGTGGLAHAEIEWAAVSANVHKFIESLPEGYSTMVGQNAALISGGQAQRVQIARELVRPATVLILDECTSALDGVNEVAVLKTVLGARTGGTTIMMTHRLAVMRMCDRILVMDEGRIAEQGTYDELIGKKGLFAQLASGGEWAGE